MMSNIILFNVNQIFLLFELKLCSIKMIFILKTEVVSCVTLDFTPLL